MTDAPASPTPAVRGRRSLAAMLLAGLFATPAAVLAGEGGTTHVIPGAMATLADNPPADGPLTFMKPMYLHYSGSATVPIPTAAGLVGNLEATSNGIALTAGHAFGTKVLRGATYTVAVALPYNWLDVSGDLQTP